MPPIPLILENLADSRHPRLFADAGRWEELRNQNDEISLRLKAIIRRQADNCLREPDIPLERKGRRLLGPIRIIQAHVLLLAMAHKLEGRKAHRDKAVDKMRQLAALSDWNPSHFLDTAEATLAVAVGYDWLFEHLSDGERALFANVILEKGLKPSDPPSGEEPWWVSAATNWAQVCHAGMAAGALAIIEQEQDFSRRILERSVRNLAPAGSAYQPDGVYPEGPAYWEYGTTFHVMLISLLESAFGARMGLDEFPGFRASAEYAIQITTPAGRCFNYGDNQEQPGFRPVLFWFARQLADPGLLEQELKMLEERTDDDAAWQDRRRNLPLSLLWWNPNPGETVEKERALHWIGHGKASLAIHRSSWRDPDAWWIGLRAGTSAVSHGHLDVGSFVLEAYGLRWSEDLGPQDYHSLESAGLPLWDMGQESARWDVFRLGPDAHNGIRFNGSRPLVTGYAPIIDFHGDGLEGHTVADLAPIFPDDVAQARRGVRFCAGRAILLQDEWTAGDKPASACWQWLTRADVSLEGNSAMLTQNQKVLHLRIVSPGGQKFDLCDVSSPVHPYDEPNPGLKRLEIRTEVKAGEHGLLAVLVTPEGTVAPFEVTPMQAWRASPFLLP